MAVIYSKNGQAMPEKMIPFGREAFETIEGTEIRWLGNGGVMINSRGNCLMIDPLLAGFDMPLFFPSPVKAAEVPELAALLVTHIDHDHYSEASCLALENRVKAFHTTHAVAEKMLSDGLKNVCGHGIGEHFALGNMKIFLTPALHNWQNGVEEFAYRSEWKPEDGCGFRLETLDGSIWMPGDSRLMEEQLHMPSPKLILFDFSDNDWHITFEGAVKLANAYPEATLFCIHWGTVDAPDFTPFNGDPNRLRERIVNPQRLIAPNPGEAYVL